MSRIAGMSLLGTSALRRKARRENILWSYSAPVEEFSVYENSANSDRGN